MSTIKHIAALLFIITSCGANAASVDVGGSVYGNLAIERNSSGTVNGNTAFNGNASRALRNGDTAYQGISGQLEMNGRAVTGNRGAASVQGGVYGGGYTFRGRGTQGSGTYTGSSASASSRNGGNASMNTGGSTGASQGRFRGGKG